MKRISVLFSSLVVLLAFIGFAPRAYAALTFGSGVYTNLCGSGTDATSHACSGACNPAQGSCSANSPFVVKFTCDGRVTACGENQVPFSNSQSLAGTACNKSVQIDVYNKNCGVVGSNWGCVDEHDVMDYMVWYSGTCQASPSPVPTPTPTLIPTPTPTPTLIPTPTPTQTTGSGGGGGGGGGPAPQAPVTMFSRCDSLTASSGNNTTAPSNVIFNVTWTETKNGVNRYRFWYGDGIHEETDVPIILHRYENPGKYHASVEIRDSDGQWKSSDGCATDVVLSSLRRPQVLAATGTPTVFTVFSLVSGIFGLGLLARRKLLSKILR